MEKPRVAANNPAMVTLEPGAYFWCACGRSQNQPFCDGSHKATTIKPVQFKIDKKKEAWLCRCKQTGNPPYCDGSHKKT